MTRTRRLSSTNSSIQLQDRHLQRNGGDIRPQLKKMGSGKGNWGSLYDEISLSDEFGISSNGSGNGENESKIQVLDETAFNQARRLSVTGMN
ncbi:hypothetical protein HDU76_000140 [Blyttiomyces sp. JEL0837]|nr:hypothetical protein HDU76_000140 [Blyttiomyces sp. JEL0837]